MRYRCLITFQLFSVEVSNLKIWFLESTSKVQNIDVEGSESPKYVYEMAGATPWRYVEGYIILIF